MASCKMFLDNLPRCWIARHPGHGSGTFRCGAEGANVIRRKN